MPAAKQNNQQAEVEAKLKEIEAREAELKAKEDALSAKEEELAKVDTQSKVETNGLRKLVCAVDSSWGKKGQVVAANIDYESSGERTKTLLKPYKEPDVEILDLTNEDEA